MLPLRPRAASWRWLPVLLYVVFVLSFVLWSARHTFHVGQMVLLRSQAAAIALCLMFGLGLLLMWARLLLRGLARACGRPLSKARVLDCAPVRWFALLALPGAIGLFVYGYAVERRWIAVRPLVMGASPDHGRERVRVAVISDLHVERAAPPWTELAEVVNRQQPDIIVLLGDTLNRRSALRTLQRMLAGMRAPHGKFAVRGNWDVWYWSDLPLLDGTGFRWLDSERVSLTVRGQRIDLVGLAYDRTASGRTAERLFRERGGPGWRLFLFHTPDLGLKVPAADLALSGHTHGGQISLPGYGALVTLSRFGKRFERGLVRLEHGFSYTNPGIGVEPIIPLRIGVRPEVTLLLLGQPP